MQNGLKRLFDFTVALTLLLVTLPLQVVIAVLIRLTSRGDAVYWSERVGTGNKLFRMAKFRSMRHDAPAVATHLMNDPKEWLTPLGSFLRKSSLDELPQLWNVVKGEMSLVGPRPALFNQYDLVELRTELGIHALRPGITGLAQVMGRDLLTLDQKVEYDRQYLESHSFTGDLKLLAQTVAPVIQQKSIRA